MRGSITRWFSSAANKNSTSQTFLHTTNRASQSRCNCFALAYLWAFNKHNKQNKVTALYTKWHVCKIATSGRRLIKKKIKNRTEQTANEEVQKIFPFASPDISPSCRSKRVYFLSHSMYGLSTCLQIL
jgi:hypothetical protein